MNKSYFYLVMKTHELEVPYTAKLRRVRVLLPKNYETDTDRSYPVVYFHDGQNVLYSKESFSGYSCLISLVFNLEERELSMQSLSWMW